jgi:hypothetical protein
MPDRKAIKEKILGEQNKAQEWACRARKTSSVAEPEIQEYIYRYVCCKFLLDPKECINLSITKMADKSIERALELKIPIAKEGEVATTCGAAGSSAMKVALLLNAIKKDFQVEIEPHRLGLARNTGEIGTLVYRAMVQQDSSGGAIINLPK